MSERPTTWLIYKHTCQITGKSYVGFTKKSLEKRWTEHVALAFDKRLTKKKYNFQKAISEYGADRWDHETLLKGLPSQEAAGEAEVKLIAELGTLIPSGYNEIKGGKGVKLTVEGKERHRQATKKALHQPDVRSRYLDGIRRSHSTPEFIENNKKAQKIAQNREDVIALKRKSMLKRSSQPGYVGPRAKAVEQIDQVTGNAIATFVSVTLASKVTGANLSKITEVARGLRKRAGGFGWRYVEGEANGV